jgi:hypothetical protein
MAQGGTCQAPTNMHAWRCWSTSYIWKIYILLNYPRNRPGFNENRTEFQIRIPPTHAVLSSSIACAWGRLRPHTPPVWPLAASDRARTYFLFIHSHRSIFACSWCHLARVRSLSLWMVLPFARFDLLRSEQTIWGYGARPTHLTYRRWIWSWNPNQPLASARPLLAS